LNAGLLIVVLFFALRGPTEPGYADFLQDEEVRREVVAHLVREATGAWDSHSDPDVGRILQQNAEKAGLYETKILSNTQGMREREYVLPKPAGLVRIILLGDSLVFGRGIQAGERMGIFLERYLKERKSAAELDVEVLHLAISGWNNQSECSYVRRQLSLLQPDLVVQITTLNDLGDTAGVRGFGAQSRFSPRTRYRTDVIFKLMNLSPCTGMIEANLLAHGIEYESRERYRDAARTIERFAAEIEDQGGEYLTLLVWFQFAGLAREHLVFGLRPDQRIYLAKDFWNDPSYWITERDSHWNRSGMEALARLLYGVIVRRNLLAELGLQPWDEAEEAVQRFHDPVVDLKFDKLPFQNNLDGIDHIADMTLEGAKHEAFHITCGIDADGLVSPYASIALRNRPGGELTIRGMPLGRREIRDAVVEVWVEEIAVGSFTVGVSDPIIAAWPMPSEVADREFVAIRLQADDYAYVGEDLQHCVVFRLQTVSIDEAGDSRD
jgi:lysophospholipase L1-like esterase